jgi:hypothetical protein
MITLIPLSVEHDKPIPDLVEKVQSRISTIQGVKDGGVKLSRDCRTCWHFMPVEQNCEFIHMHENQWCNNHDKYKLEAEFVQLTGRD